MRAVFKKKPILYLGCLAQQEYWSDLRADTGALFFPAKIQTKHSQAQLHKEESLFFVKGMLMAPFVTGGVSDDAAQELPIADQPTSVGRCGGTDAIPSCNTQRSRHF